MILVLLIVLAFAVVPMEHSCQLSIDRAVLAKRVNGPHCSLLSSQDAVVARFNTRMLHQQPRAIALCPPAARDAQCKFSNALTRVFFNCVAHLARSCQGARGICAPVE